ncbi:hypothetical protein_gp252 [Bacillus phage vB_BceM_WH1]|nr:hypothetical protein_gp252 [Bacillus phage vB_BceM_WH1]
MRRAMIEYKGEIIEPIAIVFRRGITREDRHIALVHTPGEYFCPVTIEAMFRYDKKQPHVLYESPRYMKILSQDLDENYSWVRINKEDIITSNESNQNASLYMRKEEAL